MNDSFFVSQLELINLQISNLYGTFLNQTINFTFDQLIKFLSEFDFSSQELIRCIELASFAGSEDLIESYDIIEEKYGFEQFNSEILPSNDSNGECSKIITNSSDWNNTNLKYSVLYTFGYVSFKLLSYIVKNVLDTKEQQNGLIYILNKIYELITIKFSLFPADFITIINLLANDIALLVAQISLYTNNLPNFKLLERTMHEITEMNVDLSPCLAFYFSQIKYFPINDSQDNEIPENFFTEVQNDEEFFDFFDFMCKLCIKYMDNSVRLEYFSIILYNYFGQVFTKFHEYIQNGSVQDLYLQLYNFIVLKQKPPTTNAQNSADTNQNLSSILQRAQNQQKLPYIFKLLVLLASFLEQDLGFVFNLDISLKNKIQALTIAARSKNYIQDFLHEKYNILQHWEYTNTNSKQFYEKCVDFIENNLNDCVHSPEYFHEFLVQLSFSNPSVFSKILNLIEEKKGLNINFFFNTISYFLLHDDMLEAFKVAKKIAAGDQLDKYILVFGFSKEQSKCVYKYTSLIHQYFLKTCNTSSSKIDKYKIYELFKNFQPLSKNSQGYAFSDIQSKIKIWDQYYSERPSLYIYLYNIEPPVSSKETSDLSQNSQLIYDFITYIASVNLAGVNEIVSSKLLTSFMVNCHYDVANKALWGLEFILSCKSKNSLNDTNFTDLFINSIITRCISNDFLGKTTLCLSASILVILLEHIHYLSEKTLKNLEYFIFLCLCSSSFETRKKCLELLKTTSNICKISIFYKKYQEEITNEGQNKSLYLFDFMKTNKEFDITKDQESSLDFKRVAGSKNQYIYMFYLGAFFKKLKEYEPEIISRIEERAIPLFISQFTPETDPYFYLNMFIFVLYTDSVSQNIAQTAFKLIPNTSEIAFAIALSNTQLKDQDVILKTVGNNFPVGSLAGATILYTLSGDQSFRDLQTDTELTEGFRFYHDNFLNYYMNTKHIVSYEAKFNLKQDIFVDNPIGNLNNDILLFSLFLGALLNIFTEIAKKNNVSIKGKFGLCHSLNPSFTHFFDNKREFSFLFNLSSTKNPLIQQIAESVLSQWIFFGKITDDESLFVSQKLSSEILSTNLLSRHFFKLLPIFTNEAIHSSSKLYSICQQFSIFERENTQNDELYSLFIPLFGQLLSLGLIAIAFGGSERRTLGYNLISCLCAGIYSQNHSNEDTEAFIKGILEFQPVICGLYADIDYSIHSLSEYLSKYFNTYSELIFSAIFKYESSLNDKLSLDSTKEQDKDVILANKNLLNVKLSHIESLLRLLNPWLDFEDFTKNGSLIKNCSKDLSCFTVYSFLYSLLSLKCANPLSSSVAAVIAKMANSSPKNALVTFCNLLHIFNKSKNNIVLKKVVLSALSLVLTVSSQILVNDILSFTKVDSWFALHTKLIKPFYSFKTTIRAILEVITELILGGSDSFIAKGHIFLTFALIVYGKHPEHCENLIKVITKTIQQVTKHKQNNYLSNPEVISDQLTKKVIFGHRSEQIQEWYSKYTPEQMKEVKEMLLKWSLLCGNLLISSISFTLLCILKPELSDKEKDNIAYTLISFSQSLHDFTLSYFNDKQNLNVIINSNSQQTEKLYGVVIISSGLSLLRESEKEDFIDISCSFINLLEPDLLPIYNAAFLNIYESFQHLYFPKSINWFHVLTVIMTNINDSSMYFMVRHILCICFMEDSIDWVSKHLSLIQFVLSPLIWNAKKDQSKYEKIFQKVQGTELQELVDTPSDLALQNYYWQASTNLTEEYNSITISYFSKLIKFGETNEIQAAFILLSEIIEKNHIDPLMEGIQFALLNAVNIHNEILEDASSYFLKSAIKNGCSNFIPIIKKAKSKVFPEIVSSVNIPIKEWKYEEDSFSDIEKIPPLLVRESGFDYSELIGENGKIEPFTSWSLLLSK